MNHRDRLRLERGAIHLHRLGARATCEFLAEVADAMGGAPCILERLAEYERNLTPAIIRAAGADRMPPRPLRLMEGGR
jgi:hypothetical protein